MRKRILLIGGDPPTRARLVRGIGAGYAPSIAESAAQFRRMDLRGLALAIVMPVAGDAGLPDLLEELWQVTGRRALILGDGVPRGIDRELAEPCAEADLPARIRDLVPAGAAEPPAPVFLFAGHRLDTAGQSLRDADGAEVALTRNEYRLLLELLRRPGRVLTRDHLLQALHSRDAEPYDRSIDMLVMRLRRKIEPDPRQPRLILTVPGSGYKFAAPVRQASDAEDAADRAAPWSGPPERRHLVVLAAELLPGANGAPAQAQEHLRWARAVIEAHGGVPAQNSGRELAACFSHPVAQEDAAERAIRAGLAITGEPARAALPPDVAFRVGVATGDVIATGPRGLLAETPVEAIRVRNSAAPGQVVIEQATRRLTGGLFLYRGIDNPASINGFEPPRHWRVLGPDTARDRPATPDAGDRTRLVGRIGERQRLLDAWQRVGPGGGRVVLLHGEPGIGKSRLLAELAAALPPDGHASLRYACSALHQGSALHPFAARLQADLGIAGDDPPEHRLDTLRERLAPVGLAASEITLLADMLGIVPADSAGIDAGGNPRRRREAVFAILRRMLAYRTARHPVLMLFEDVHWADPSSIDFLTGLITDIRRLPVLLIVSSREAFDLAWIRRPAVETLALARMDRAESRALALEAAGAGALPASTLERIVDQADGVPLHIEELTRAVLDGAPTEAGAPLPVPGTPHAAIMARLDRAPAAKQVAQVAAVIGREFSAPLLAAVAAMEGDALARGIDRLLEAGLIVRQGAFPDDPAFAFTHAMAQEAACASLPDAERADIHRRVAETIRDHHGDRAARQPEIVAHHFERANLPEPAVAWGMRAGTTALGRSAHAEATAHLERALRLAAGLGDGACHRRLRLRLRILHGNALRLTTGPGMPETSAAFAAARDLTATVDDACERFPAYHGLWSVSFLRGEPAPMRDAAAAFLRDAETASRAPEIALGHRLCGLTRWYEGDLTAARQHLEAALGHDEAIADRDFPPLFGQHIASPAMIDLALVLWLAGAVDRAGALAAEAVARAIATGHAPTIAHAHAHAVILAMLGRNRTAAAPHVAALHALAERHGMAVWLAAGRFFESWLHVDAGDPAGSVARMCAGLARMRAQQQELFMPLLELLVAEAESDAGFPVPALTRLDAQTDAIARTGQRWYHSALLRARGDILLRHAPDRTPEAKRCYHAAIAIARAQSAGLLQLQAAAALARIAALSGDPATIRDLLAPLCAWTPSDPDAGEAPGAA